MEESEDEDIGRSKTLRDAYEKWQKKRWDDVVTNATKVVEESNNETPSVESLAIYLDVQTKYEVLTTNL